MSSSRQICPRFSVATCSCGCVYCVVLWWVKWYYSVNNQPVGPVTRAQLETLYEAGTINRDTLVVQEGMGYWVPYVDLKKTTQFLPARGMTSTEDWTQKSPEPAAAGDAPLSDPLPEKK